MLEFYSPAGDILTIALCVLCWIFLLCTYIKKQPNLMIFYGCATSLIILSSENILLHWMMDNVERNTLNSYWMYTLETSVYCSMVAVFMCFVLYTLKIFDIPDKDRKTIAIFTIPVFFVYTIFRCIKPFLFEGYIITERVWHYDASTQWGFMSCYLYYTILITIIMFKFSKTIPPTVYKCLRGSIYIALALTVGQSIVPTTTFLSTSFMFPVLAALLLFHYNPYDNVTGALDKYVFADYIEDSKSHLGIFSLRLKDFHFHDDTQLATLFIKNAADIFVDYQTFRMDDATIYVVFNKDTNLSEEALQNIVERRTQYLYDIYHIPYKLLYTTVDLNILDPTDHVLLHQYCFSKMEWNTCYATKYEDAAKILRVEKIRELLKEIDQSDKLSHPAIQVYCQPIYDTHSGKYKSIEILSRLQCEDELIMPQEFLPIADYYNYSYNYDKKVFGQACKKFAELMHEDIPVERMSMNFSIREFTSPTFISDILYIIKKYDVPGEKVAIEITESIGANVPADTLRKIIWKLKARGIKVYLDDFGVDYSNLDRVLHLPVDVIKFDSCITWSLRHNSTLKPIISSMADSFRRAGYEVLFEGVETEDDELRCQHLNASYLQGYKYAKPMELDLLTEFLS